MQEDETFSEWLRNHWGAFVILFIILVMLWIGFSGSAEKVQQRLELERQWKRKKEQRQSLPLPDMNNPQGWHPENWEDRVGFEKLTQPKRDKAKK